MVPSKDHVLENRISAQVFSITVPTVLYAILMNDSWIGLLKAM